MFLVQEIALKWYKAAQQFNMVSKRENPYQAGCIFSEFPHSHLSISMEVHKRKRSLFSSQGIQGAFVCPLSLTSRTVLLLQKWHLCPGTCVFRCNDCLMDASWSPWNKVKASLQLSEVLFSEWNGQCCIACLEMCPEKGSGSRSVRQSAVDRAKDLQSQSSVLQDWKKGDPIPFSLTKGGLSGS